jgi:hypothetical protein
VGVSFYDSLLTLPSVLSELSKVGSTSVVLFPNT